MNSIFNPADGAEFIRRIEKLAPTTQAQWGKMNAAQMLAHVGTTMKVALGELKLTRSFMGILMGRIARKQLAGDKPFGRNLPTDKHFIVTDQRDFETEKQALLKLILRFPHVGPSGITNEAHPFFGTMSTEEWDRLTCNHLDHHLRQFGV